MDSKIECPEKQKNIPRTICLLSRMHIWKKGDDPKYKCDIACPNHLVCTTLNCKSSVRPGHFKCNKCQSSKKKDPYHKDMQALIEETRKNKKGNKKNKLGIEFGNDIYSLIGDDIEELEIPLRKTEFDLTSAIQTSPDEFENGIDPLNISVLKGDLAGNVSELETSDPEELKTGQNFDAPEERFAKLVNPKKNDEHQEKVGIFKSFLLDNEFYCPAEEGLVGKDDCFEQIMHYPHECIDSECDVHNIFKKLFELRNKPGLLRRWIMSVTEYKELDAKRGKEITDKLKEKDIENVECQIAKKFIPIGNCIIMQREDRNKCSGCKEASKTCNSCGSIVLEVSKKGEVKSPLLMSSGGTCLLCNAAKGRATLALKGHKKKISIAVGKIPKDILRNAGIHNYSELAERSEEEIFNLGISPRIIIYLRKKMEGINKKFTSKVPGDTLLIFDRSWMNFFCRKKGLLFVKDPAAFTVKEAWEKIGMSTILISQSRQIMKKVGLCFKGEESLLNDIEKDKEEEKGKDKKSEEEGQHTGIEETGTVKNKPRDIETEKNKHKKEEETNQKPPMIATNANGNGHSKLVTVTVQFGVSTEEEAITAVKILKTFGITVAV